MATQKSTIIECADQVWCISSNAPGPTIGFVGGTHGNEAAGIAVVQRFHKAFRMGDLTLTRGTLMLAFGNPEAIALNQRSTAPGRDLNRCFRQSVLQTPPDDTFESQRAYELAHALKQVEIGIDLHATNLPSTPFLVVQELRDGPVAEALRFLDANILLTDPHWVFAGEPNTLDEFFNRESGRIGICYETGFAEDVSRVIEIEQELLDLLRHFAVIEGVPRVRPLPPKARHELVAALIPKHDGFVFADEETLANFRTVSAGSVIGYDENTPVIASHSGVLVFPKAKHLRFPDKPVGYIARHL